MFSVISFDCFTNSLVYGGVTTGGTFPLLANTLCAETILWIVSFAAGNAIKL